MLKLLKDTLYIDRSTAGLSAHRRRSYLTVLWVVVGLHLVGIMAVVYATSNRNFTHSPDGLEYFSSLLGLVSTASSLLIVFLSLKSEALIAQTYDLTAATTQATSHEFKEFMEHLAWLKDNLSPDRFPDTQHLCFSVSTPIYGIGADHCADEFLDFFERWVFHFENTSVTESATPPRWDFAVWNAEDNARTFGTANYDWNSRANRMPLKRFAQLLTRAYKLHEKRRLDLHVYFTDASHARLFMARASGERFGGLVVLFSPLTASAIKEVKWALIGFSFRDAQAFHNISRFNLKLQQMDHSKVRPDDHVQVLKDPSEWLHRHYGINPLT